MRQWPCSTHHAAAPRRLAKPCLAGRRDEHLAAASATDAKHSVAAVVRYGTSLASFRRSMAARRASTLSAWDTRGARPPPRLPPQSKIEQAEAGGCPGGMVLEARRQLHRLLLAEVRAELDAALKLSRAAEKSVAQRLSSLKVGGLAGMPRVTGRRLGSGLAPCA